MRLTSFAFLALASAALAQVTPGRDVPSFVACLNQALDSTALTNAGNPNGFPNVADSVQCLPQGCKMTVTMSEISAQGACAENPNDPANRVQLPRVIFSCPGPGPGLRFRPSYSLCPIGFGGANNVTGGNRIEIGEDVVPVAANMKMADVPVKTNVVWNTSTGATEVLSIKEAPPFVNNADKGCNSCHFAATPGNAVTFLGQPATTINSKFMDPFGIGLTAGKLTKVYLLPFVIDTTEPNKKNATASVINPKAPATAQSLSQICDAINTKGSVNAKKMLPLCQKLVDYQTTEATRRSCGNGTSNDGRPLRCAGINGGGTFLENQVTSTVSMDVSGQAKVNADGTFQFVDMEGGFATFNYGTRTQATVTTISSLTVAANQGSASGTGIGTVVINGGAPATHLVAFSITNIGTADLTVNITGTLSGGEFALPIQLAKGKKAAVPPGTRFVLSGF